MKYLLILLLSSTAFAGQWVQCPGGVVPDSENNVTPIVFYESLAACGVTDCYRCDTNGERCELAWQTIQNGVLRWDDAKKQAAIDAKNARKNARENGAASRDIELKQCVQDLKAVNNPTQGTIRRCLHVLLREVIKERIADNEQ